MASHLSFTRLISLEPRIFMRNWEQVLLDTDIVHFTFRGQDQDHILQNCSIDRYDTTLLVPGIGHQIINQRIVIATTHSFTHGSCVAI
jgi:hypothetical protein